ncbi:hypothetical protein [Thermomonospora cellulosilytica]|uniref:Sugar lactone lactonase YvrE n=1 Tax=Thermomonospora cellulosilytica TaxID=1411118 RepID=A0A7W3RA01_9ACTN|nr:hypothetical protein [Thermomonospora cellulosilytica]MBA9005297.1 sugar lactone lactonase YvrE [Thermomonospora cellulosilytica]
MFHVHPRPQTAPLSVAAGGESPLKPIDELVGTDASTGLDTMFIRVVKTGTGCAPSGAPDPGIKLKAGDGDPVEVPRFPETASIFNGPGGTGTAVADATMQAEPGDVYLVRAFVYTRGSQWKIQLVNHDQTTAHAFTWVVADNDPETRQPWIDAPTGLTFDVEAGQTSTQQTQIANLGTGTLTITDKEGTQPGPGFALTAVPEEIEPNACGDLEVTFTAPHTPGTSSADHSITSNDTTAQPTAGHNRQITLTATTTRRLARGTVIVAATKAGEPDETGISLGGVFRVDLATGEQTKVSSGGFVQRPCSVLLDADGTILVGDDGENKVIRVDPVTGEQSVVVIVSAQLLDLSGEAGGTIVVLCSDEFGTGGILRVDPGTGAQTPLASGDQVSGVQKIAAEAGGTILLLKLGEPPFDLTRVDPATGAQTILTSFDESTTPMGMAVEPGGGILITDSGSAEGGRVLRVDPGSGEQTTLSHGGLLHMPVAAAVEADGTVLVADMAVAGEEGGVIRIDPVSGTQTKVSTGGLFRGVLAIAVVPENDD